MNTPVPYLVATQDIDEDKRIIRQVELTPVRIKTTTNMEKDEVRYHAEVDVVCKSSYVYGMGIEAQPTTINMVSHFLTISTEMFDAYHRQEEGFAEARRRRGALERTLIGKIVLAEIALGNDAVLRSDELIAHTFEQLDKVVADVVKVAGKHNARF